MIQYDGLEDAVKGVILTFHNLKLHPNQNKFYCYTKKFVDDNFIIASIKWNDIEIWQSNIILKTDWSSKVAGDIIWKEQLESNLLQGLRNLP